MRFPAILMLLFAAVLAGCSSGNSNKLANKNSSTRATTIASATPTTAAATRPPATPTPVVAVRTPTPAPSTAARSAASAIVAATSDNPIAARLTLTAADFPASWSHSPYDASNDATAPCDVATPGQTAKVHSDDFAPDDNSQISETVILTSSPTLASAMLDGVQGSIDCGVKAVNAGVLDDSTTRYSQATGAPLPFPTYGDATKSYRVRFHADGIGRNSNVSLSVYIDAIYVVRGRGGFSITAFSLGAPYDSVQLQTIVNRALTRYDQGLSATR